jgi:hypothetical protein
MTKLGFVHKYVGGYCGGMYPSSYVWKKPTKNSKEMSLLTITTTIRNTIEYKIVSSFNMLYLIENKTRKR